MRTQKKYEREKHVEQAINKNSRVITPKKYDRGSKLALAVRTHIPQWMHPKKKRALAQGECGKISEALREPEVVPLDLALGTSRAD